MRRALMIGLAGVLLVLAMSGTALATSKTWQGSVPLCATSGTYMKGHWYYKDGVTSGMWTDDHFMVYCYNPSYPKEYNHVGIIQYYGGALIWASRAADNPAQLYYENHTVANTPYYFYASGNGWGQYTQWQNKSGSSCLFYYDPYGSKGPWTRKTSIQY